MKLGRNDLCWCGSHRKYKACHMQFDERLEEYKNQGFTVPDHKLLKTKEQIEGIKKSAAINMACLDAVGKVIHEGMSTQEIDDIVYRVTTEMGGIPAPLNYEGFPKSVCTSINDVVCHGIPDENMILEDGDIINVDVSTIYQGYFSDSSRMFLIGNVSEENRRLVRVTKECMEKGLEKVKPWVTLGEMSQAVHEHAEKNGFSVVREIGGHGIGLEFHEDPWVSYVANAGEGMLMVPGLCFTIEPMVNAGAPDVVLDDEDGWTIYTEDGSPSAQWEIQVLVTETGYELLCW